MRPRLRVIQGGLSEAALPQEWRKLGDRIIDCTSSIGKLLASGCWSEVARLIEYRRSLLEELRSLSHDSQSRRCVAALEAAIQESEGLVAVAAAAHVSRCGTSASVIP